MKKRRKNKKGFTLGEIVTTVAIVGSITAVAVPNYLRVKMEMNMESVRQYLEKFHQEMNGLLNRDGRFPDDVLNLGNGAEDVSLTASLSAINLKEYTTDGYLPIASASSYSFRTCPVEGRFSISGDRCFLVDPLGVRRVGAFSLSGLSTYVAEGVTASTRVSNILGNPTLSDDEKAKILGQIFEYHAIDADFGKAWGYSYQESIRRNRYGDGAPPHGWEWVSKKDIPSYYMVIYEQDAPKLQALIPKIGQYMKARGAEPFFADQTLQDLKARRQPGTLRGADTYREAWSGSSQYKFIEVGVKFSRPTTCDGSKPEWWQEVPVRRREIPSDWKQYVSVYDH
jgi:type II secretory pathway pseudopilin PulG